MDTGLAIWGELITILVMAVALGFDAFSLGLGIGMKGIRVREILKIGVVVALFHIMMPLAGLFMGQYVGSLLGSVATLAAGGLLLLLGGHMIYSSLRGDAAQSIDYRSGWAIILFSLSVSIDSFSVGVSLGMFQINLWLTILTFGLFGGMMSILGLLLGSRVSHRLSEYGEAFGGVILFTFGVLFIL
ncbi:manganese efflux pump MntP [Paenibacillus guangzhouensis]|uniref:manganese efflux pump MntP n=1 Tax=Paenibacillus guangzhouensis TaxID=1473112 RepID=UPI001266FF94|nr:manganese efflux pump [Paenibacillus guangzhouensis]